MATCSPSELAAAAACFSCLEPQAQAAVELELLRQIAESTATPAELAQAAGCFSCLEEPVKAAAELELLRQWSGCEPEPVCSYDLMVDLEPNGDDYAQYLEWFSESDQSQDLGVTEISFNATTLEATQMRVSYMPSLQSLVAPNTFDLGEPSILANPDLLTVSAPLATKIYGSQIYIQGNPLLQSVSFPSLQEVPFFYRGRIFEIKDNPSLTTIDLGSFLPKESDNWGGCCAQNAVFTNNALNAATVNHILARFLANPLWGVGNGTPNHLLDLSGGSNAAPTGQGIIDKAALIARGSATVLTN